jgi:hypothetical protein
MFQQDHQEIPYSPAHIFAERHNSNIATVPTITTGTATDATTLLSAAAPTTPSSNLPESTSNVNMPSTGTATPAPAGTTHTAGAHTLLLAAQVLHEGTNHKSNQPSEANVTKRNRQSPTVTAAHTSTLKMNGNGDTQEDLKGSKTWAKNGKQPDVASSENDAQSNKNVPVGHVELKDGRIVLLIPDADITNNDVLLGRGGRTNHHIGNATYRTYKESLQDEYLQARKDEKTNISNRLVTMIHEKHGRFLKAYEPDKNATKNTTGIVEFWYEVDLLTARKKASQALREINTPENRAAKREKYKKVSK